MKKKRISPKEKDIMNTASHSVPVILASDAICARVICRGSNVISLNLSGMSSMADLYRAVADATRELKGMVTLSLRNLSQGWNISRPLMLSA